MAAQRNLNKHNRVNRNMVISSSNFLKSGSLALLVCSYNVIQIRNLVHDSGCLAKILRVSGVAADMWQMSFRCFPNPNFLQGSKALIRRAIVFRSLSERVVATEKLNIVEHPRVFRTNANFRRVM